MKAENHTRTIGMHFQLEFVHSFHLVRTLKGFRFATNTLTYFNFGFTRRQMHGWNCTEHINRGHIKFKKLRLQIVISKYTQNEILKKNTRTNDD